jgi:hypothetical protein
VGLSPKSYSFPAASDRYSGIFGVNCMSKVDNTLNTVDKLQEMVDTLNEMVDKKPKTVVNHGISNITQCQNFLNL